MGKGKGLKTLPFLWAKSYINKYKRIVVHSNIGCGNSGKPMEAINVGLNAVDNFVDRLWIACG